uniref:Uncharacterized protein n=1 Tax=Nelumbo nucifera TaxID=4432 RepID=A0A822Z2Y7_NELNU|nr:TPA_asm: hypothetical protein HUJ06_007987 [Nelumbo nucifera]
MVITWFTLLASWNDPLFEPVAASYACRFTEMQHFIPELPLRQKRMDPSPISRNSKPCSISTSSKTPPTGRNSKPCSISTSSKTLRKRSFFLTLKYSTLLLCPSS